MKGEVRGNGRAVIAVQYGCHKDHTHSHTVLTRVEKFKSDPFVHLTSTSHSFSPVVVVGVGEFTASISTSSASASPSAFAFWFGDAGSSWYVSIEHDTDGTSRRQR
jgi:hypothetical protein